MFGALLRPLIPTTHAIGVRNRISRSEPVAARRKRVTAPGTTWEQKPGALGSLSLPGRSVQSIRGMSDVRVARMASNSSGRCLLRQTVHAQPLLYPHKRPSTSPRSCRYQSVSTQTPVPGPRSEATLTCESCGRDTPIPAVSGVSRPRARCAECEIAVEAALDDVVRQLVGLGHEAGDPPSGAMTCFDCGAPCVGDQDGIAKPFVCSACGSR